MTKIVKIPKDAKYQQYVDLARYRNQQPGILNMYYQANLLEIIDQLPQQLKKQQQPEVPRASLHQPSGIQYMKTEISTQNLTGTQISLTNVVMSFKHEFDGLGNDTAINGYQISKTMLGRGSHSFVKLAKKQGQNYAIKIISYDRLKKRIIIKDQHITKMINCQISLLLKLKSEHIIGFQQAIYLQAKQRVFLVLEYCSKGSLLKYINTMPAMAFVQWQKTVKKYMLEIAKGLQKMHENNIIHRDVKSQNVLINQRNEVKIIDFNVSSEIPASGIIKITDKFVGTKTYAPPELVISSAESRQVDGRLIDVWALGVTYIQLLQRAHPFNVNTPAQLIKKLQSPIQLNINFEPELQDLLKKMMKFQNKQRIQVSEVIKHSWFRK